MAKSDQIYFVEGHPSSQKMFFDKVSCSLRKLFATMLIIKFEILNFATYWKVDFDYHHNTGVIHISYNYYNYVIVSIFY